MQNTQAPRRGRIRRPISRESITKENIGKSTARHVTAVREYMTTVDQLVYRKDEKVSALVAADITFYLTRFEGTEQTLTAAYERTIAPIRRRVHWYRTERMK